MRIANLFIVGVWTAVAWGQAPAGWTLEASVQVRQVADVTPSPDGKLVAYTERRTIIEAEKSEFDTQIFLARADGSYRVQLTRGEKSATAPSFSPDGRYVYFSSDRSGKQNVWRIPVDGGEAEMLSDWKGEMGDYHLSPDGKWLAFAGRELGDEEKRAKEKADFRAVDENPKNRGLWVIPAEADSQGKRAARKIGDTPGNVLDFDWSPDSKNIAFAHTPTPSENDWPKSDISEVNVETGAVRAIAATGAAELSPRYSPDGRYLAFLRTTDPARWPGMVRIVVLPRDGGEARELPRTYDEKPFLIGWSADSSRIVFAEAKGTAAAIYAIPLDGATLTLYDPVVGTLTPGHLNTTGTELGLTAESWDQAPEAFVMKLGERSPHRVSAANRNLPRLALGKTEHVSWRAGDGLDIDALLTYPAGYESGKRYPLVLVIHGGPAGNFEDTFLGRFGLYPYASFAAQGIAVLRVNPHGSDGYGRDFRFSNLNDWGGKDYLDLMAGVDHVIAMGVADADKLAVMGWSYGGFLTSWVITHTHRFKAAAVGAGVTDLWSMTGTSDIPSFLPDYFGGEPWDNFDTYYQHSPMASVKGVTTPTLILHGESDVRVPTSQGYELYNALKRQGVTTQMVVYPRTPHGPKEPKFILDIMERNLEWAERIK